nr:unnamed protein product [Digitaria exilis]
MQLADAVAAASPTTVVGPRIASDVGVAAVVQAIADQIAITALLLPDNSPVALDLGRKASEKAHQAAEIEGCDRAVGAGWELGFAPD